MSFNGNEISELVTSYLWVFFRIAALIGIMPVFGSNTVPVRIRVALAMLITVVIVPTLPVGPQIDPFSLTGTLVTVQQVLIGMVMAFALIVVLTIFVHAGQLIAMQMGLAFASMVDPQNGNQVPTISQFYMLLITLVFLSLNGHLITIQLLSDSFRILPVSTIGISSSALWELCSLASRIFSGAVIIALPALISLLLVNVAFAILSRAAPQLNIFSIGFPLSIILGVMAMYVTLPGVTARFSSEIEGGFELIVKMLQGGP